MAKVYEVKIYQFGRLGSSCYRYESMRQALMALAIFARNYKSVKLACIEVYEDDKDLPQESRVYINPCTCE